MFYYLTNKIYFGDICKFNSFIMLKPVRTPDASENTFKEFAKYYYASYVFG